MSEAKSVSRAAALRASFPEGTIPVAAALLIAGVATYLFFQIGTNAVGGAENFAPLSSLWFATFALAPGFFLPLEQELGRGLGHRRAVGEGGRPVVAKVARLGFLLGGLVALAIICLSPLITSAYFDGDWVMLVALVVAFCAYAPAHLARGICSGSGRFHSYAVVIGSDGVVRVTVCIAVRADRHLRRRPVRLPHRPVAAGRHRLRRVEGAARRRTTGPEATWKEVTPNLGWLLLGSVFAAGLLNAGPVLVNILSEDTPEAEEAVTEFGYGVLLARIPLFMFQAVQAALLPRLSRLAASGNFAEFRNGLRRLLVLVIGVGVIGSLGALAIGPFVLEKVYDAELDGVDAGDPRRRQRVLHGRPRPGPSGDRPQGPLARRPRLGHRRRRPGPRRVAGQRRRVPPGRDRRARLVDRGDDVLRLRPALQAGLGSPPRRRSRSSRRSPTCPWSRRPTIRCVPWGS